MTCWAVCAALLEQVPYDQRESLLDLLSPEERALAAAQIPANIDIQESFPDYAEQLASIHPSWIAPLLRQFTERDIRLFLAVLEENQAESIRRIIRLNNHVPVLKSLGIEFCQKWLLQSLTQDSGDVLPVHCLPPSPLNALLQSNHQELTHIAEHLGLYDVAFDLRRIIDTAKIKKIYACFTQEEVNQLRKLIHSRDPVSFKSLGLQDWDGNTSSFKKTVLQRGINRLAKAFYPEHPSLKWHIVHRLDEDQGTLFVQLCTPLNIPNAVSALREQVLEALDITKANTKKEI